MLNPALGTFLLALAIRVGYIAAMGWGEGLLSPFPVSDAAFYLHNAWITAFVDADGGYLANVVSASPYVDLQVLAFRLAGPHLAVPFLLNALLGALAAAMIAAASTVLFGRAAGWIAGLLVASCGPLVFFGGLTMKSTLVSACLATALWAAISSAGSWHWRRFALGGALLALAAIDRNNLMVLLPIYVLAGLPAARQARAVPMWLLGVACAAMTFAGYVQRDLGQRDDQLLSPVGFNFFVGNNKDAKGGYTAVPEIRNDLIGTAQGAIRVARKAAGADVDMPAVNRYWLGRGLDWIAEDPLGFIKLQLFKAVLLLAQETYGLPEQYGVARSNTRFLFALGIDFAVLLALVVVALASGASRLVTTPALSRAPQALLAAAVLYGGSVSFFFVAERFRLPAYLLLAPLAAVGVLEILRARERSRQLGLLGLALMVYLGSCGLTVLHTHGAGWAKDHRRAYIQTSQRREWDRFVAELKTTAVRDGGAKNWFVLSRHFSSREHTQDAIAFADLAVQAEPDSIIGYAELKRVLLHFNRPLDLLEQRIEFALADEAVPRPVKRQLRRMLESY